MTEMIILVDRNDKELGSSEKLEAHIKGKLHRAFSIFIFNSKGEMLMQKREKSKYHSGGLWTNTCCSHPRIGENLEEAVHRRLAEEMGFDCELKKIFNFTYRAKLDKDIIEYEFDHVFIGIFDGDPVPNPDEVDEWKWARTEELVKDIRDNPQSYTHWFVKAIDKVLEREMNV